MKTVKYGETSLIGSIFTERLGLQSYMLKGLRSTKSKSKRAQLFFSSSMLEMIVYHNPQRNLQIIKEFQPDYYYKTVGESVLKNGIALFAMEVLLQLLVTDDIQEELFLFSIDFLKELDMLNNSQLANLPIYFLIQSGKLMGYHFSGYFSATTPFLDLSEGRFSEVEPMYPPFIGNEDAACMSRLKNAQDLKEIINIKINNEARQRILGYFLDFFQKHIPHFRNMKSVAILSAILH